MLIGNQPNNFILDVYGLPGQTFNMSPANFGDKTTLLSFIDIEETDSTRGWNWITNLSAIAAALGTSAQVFAIIYKKSGGAVTDTDIRSKRTDVSVTIGGGLTLLKDIDWNAPSAGKSYKDGFGTGDPSFNPLGVGTNGVFTYIVSSQFYITDKWHIDSTNQADVLLSDAASFYRYKIGGFFFKSQDFAITQTYVEERLNDLFNDPTIKLTDPIITTEVSVLTTVTIVFSKPVGFLNGDGTLNGSPVKNFTAVTGNYDITGAGKGDLQITDIQYEKIGSRSILTNVGFIENAATLTLSGTPGIGVININLKSNVNDFNTIVDTNGNPLTESFVPYTGVAIESVPPTLDTVSISSDNPNPLYAKVGDTITLQMIANEVIEQPTVTIGDLAGTVTYTGSGASWNADYKMESGDTEGLVTFLISNIVDLADNIAPDVNTATTGSVTFMKTVPTITSGDTLDPDNTTVTVTFSKDVYPGTGASGNLLPEDFNLIFNQNSGTATNARISEVRRTAGDTFALTLSVNPAANGDETIEIKPFAGQIFDAAGNVAENTTTTGEFNLKDHQGPSLTLVSIASNNAAGMNSSYAKIGDTVTLSINANEDIIEPIVKFNNQQPVPLPLMVNGSGAAWVASYTLLDTDTEGNIGFLISNIKDTSARQNTANNVNSTTGGSSVLFIKPSPIITGWVLADDNSNITVAFDKAVYTSTGASGELTFLDFNLVFTQNVSNGGTATSVAIRNVVHTADNRTAILYLDVSPSASGFEQIEITPVQNQIFDAAGNPVLETTTTGPVLLKAFSGPVLNVVSIQSNNYNGLNPAYAKALDKITLTIKATKDIVAPTVQIMGVTPDSVNGSGTDWTATYTILGSELEGIVNFAITGILDTENPVNPGLAGVIATNDGTSVNYIKPSPIISVGNVAPDNSKIKVIFNRPVYSNPGAIGNLDISDFQAPIFNANVGGTATGVTIISVQHTAGDSRAVLYFDVNPSASGTETIEILPQANEIYDAAGNPALDTTTTGAQSLHAYDGPVLKNVRIFAANAPTQYAKTGETVTLAFAANKTINTPVVSIAGNVVAASFNGIDWIATYTTTSNDPEGFIRFLIRDITDGVTPAADVFATTDRSSVIYQKPLPVIIGAGLSNDNTKLYITFDRPVYSDSNAIGDLVIGDFNLSFNENGGHTTVVNIEQVIHKAGESTAQLNLSLDNPATSGQTIEVKPATNQIYDAAGNLASDTDTTNLIELHDFHIPVLELVEIYSNNNPVEFANIGEVITVEIKANEAIQKPVFKIAGHTIDPVEVNGSGTSWNASYSMASGDPEGEIKFEISSIRDIAGNSSPNVSVVTDNAVLRKVEFYESAPVMETAELETDNSFVKVTFDRGVYSNIGAIDKLVKDDFVLSFTENGNGLDNPGNATAVNISDVAHVVGENTAFIYLDITNTPPNSNETITVGPKANQIFDGASNAALATNTQGPIFLYDFHGPVLSTVKIESNNAAIAFAKIDDTITLTIIAREEMLQPTVKIATHTLAIANIQQDTLNGTSTKEGYNTHWIATYDMEDIDVEGDVPFEISQLVDQLGNVNSGLFSTITEGSRVTFYKTVPKINTTSLAPGNQYVDLTFNRVVYSAEGATGALTSDNFNLTVLSVGGASVVAIKNIPFDHTEGTNSVRIYLTITGTPNGLDTIKINPVNADPLCVYGPAGNKALSADSTGIITLNDFKGPSIESIFVVSNNVRDNQFARTGQIITLSIHTNEDIEKPSIKIAGHVIDPEDVTGGGQDWQATYTLQAPPVDNEGLITYSITNIQDTSPQNNLGNDIIATSGVMYYPTMPCIVGGNIVEGNLFINVIFNRSVFPALVPATPKDPDNYFTLLLTQPAGGTLTAAMQPLATPPDSPTITIGLDLSQLGGPGEFIEIQAISGTLEDIAGNIITYDTVSECVTTGKVALADLSSGTPDVYVRDGIDDNGTVPSKGQLNSPDILLFTSYPNDATLEPYKGPNPISDNTSNPKISTTQDSYIVIRTRNRGTAVATNTRATAYWTHPGHGANPNQWEKIDSVYFPSNIANDGSYYVSRVLTWPQDQLPPKVEYSIVVTVGCVGDPEPTTAEMQQISNEGEFKHYIHYHNNVCSKKVHFSSSNSSNSGPGNSGNAPGHTGNNPGHSGGSHGNSGNAPGHTGNNPGHSGGSHGNSGNAPGHTGNNPGKSSSAPGHSGDPVNTPAPAGKSGKSRKSGKSSKGKK
ncbi:MAG: hypothetical protein ABUK01_11780 [Leptospirales bacterium]